MNVTEVVDPKKEVRDKSKKWCHHAKKICKKLFETEGKSTT